MCAGLDGGGHERGVLHHAHIVVQVAHQPPVTAAVAGIAACGFLDGNGTHLPGEMLGDGDFAGAVFLVEGTGAQLGLGAVDFDVAAFFKSGHGESAGDAAHVAQDGHQVVGLVVVLALESIASPGGGPEPFGDILRRGFVHTVHHHPEPAAAGIVGDVLAGIPRVLANGGGPVGAAGRAGFSQRFLAEERELTEAGNLLAGAVEQPVENIHIMAALGHNHGGGLGAVAPVAAHEGMPEMPGSHTLVGIESHDFAQFPAVDDIADGIVERRVAQHVADSHPAPQLLGQVAQLQRLAQGFGNRFLQQQVIPQLQRTPGGLEMVDAT